MLRFKKFKKKTIAVAISAITVSLVLVGVGRAEGGGGMDASVYLQEIAANTGAEGILHYVDNTLPYALGQLAQLALSWLHFDDSSYTSNMQSSFTTLSSALNTSSSTQTTMTENLLQDYFQGFSQDSLSYANDLDFGSLIGKPLWSPDPRGNTTNFQFNYLKNASSLSIQHSPPNPNWKGNDQDKDVYDQYYRTMTAAQTLNGYIMSQVAADFSAGLSTIQQTLLTQATDPKFFLAVSSTEQLGVVMRQLLLFASQSYVLQLQLLQTEKQLLAAQATGNTIAAAGNLGSEGLMLSKAIRPMSGP